MLIGLFVLTGCEEGSPTKEVESFLSKYQTLDNEIVTKITDEVNNDTELTSDQKEKYIDFWKKHYQEMVYTIKDEEINGDKATVKVEIEVNDYSKVITATNTYLVEHPNDFIDVNQQYDVSKFNDYKLDQLDKTSDRVKYTFEFNVNKIDKKWQLEDLTEEDYLKLTGMYQY